VVAQDTVFKLDKMERCVLIHASALNPTGPPD